MQARRYLLVLLILLVVGIFTSVFTVSAQSDVCGTIIRQAENEAGTNCANQATNTTCAGHEGVSRTTSSGVVSTTYTTGGDTANLATTHVVSSQPLNAATGEYGINVLNAAAGAPVVSNGKGVIFVLFGGTTLTNVGGAGQAIWQNVALSVQGNSAPCAGVPSFLLIQNPPGATTSVTVNGASMLLSSSVAIRLVGDAGTPAGTLIDICVLDGSVTLGQGANQVTAGPGQCVRARLNPSGRIVPSSFEPPFTISPEELAAILAVTSGFPANLLHYPPGQVVVNCPSGIGQPNCTVQTGP
jgi:hypothetical protein